MYGLSPVRGVATIDFNMVAGGFITVEGDETAQPTVLYGEGFTINRSAEGVYVISFASPNPAAVISIIATAGAKTAAAPMTCDVDPDTITTAGFTIRTFVEGSDGVQAAGEDAGSRVSFLAIVSDSFLDA